MELLLPTFQADGNFQIIAPITQIGDMASNDLFNSNERGTRLDNLDSLEYNLSKRAFGDSKGPPQNMVGMRTRLQLYGAPAQM